MNGKIIKCIALGLFAFVGLLIVTGLVLVMFGLFTDGKPPNTSDLIPKRIPIADSENGFLLLRNIGPLVHWDRNEQTSKDWLQGKNWDQAKVDELLSQNREALARLDRALALPGFQFEEMKSIDQKVEYLTPIMDLWRVKNLSAISRWRQKKEHTAIEESFQTLELGHRILNGGGVLIHFLVGIAVETNALNNFSRFASDASLQQIGELKSAILRLETYADHTDSLINAMKAESVGFTKIIGDITSRRLSLANMSITPAPPLDNMSMRLLFQPNNTRILFAETYRQIIMEAPLIYDKAEKEPGWLKTYKTKSSMERLLSPNAAGNMLCAIAMSPVISIVSKKCRITAQVRMTQVLLAVRCHWLEHGKLPDTLDELVPAYLPAVPIDEYDGKTLRYSAARKVIYSVGKDLIDSGGDLSDDNKERDKEPTLKINW